MPWYLIVYLLVFVLVGLAGIAEDWQSRRPLPFIAGMLIALSVGVLCICAFALHSVGRAVGVWLWPLLAFAVVMEVWSFAWDLRDLVREKQTSRREAAIITLLVAAITLPAYVLGAAAAARLGS